MARTVPVVGDPELRGPDRRAVWRRAFWAWAIVEVLRHTGMRIEEALELAHHSFVAYQLPTTGEIVPMLQVAPSKLDQERLLLVSPELGEVLTAITIASGAGSRPCPWSPPTTVWNGSGVRRCRSSSSAAAARRTERSRATTSTPASTTPSPPAG
ncbi:hypothetical protein [Streptomyces tubercidicus]|uniref:hypothetical protein n=1 Tax=Streptomyces tubercidicus TaxID=47759 RepID=UPI0013568EDA|nr:hypothetical protein [Streptomyces tubercidicus]WAU14957.1 hypothetical protein STRTU_005621 [Streptomyces tubercidicus]